ncbi:unnamed protein product [Medioppia subpectinata]|uniref:Alpha-amylase n=1 Tax=Medioppia subpectinata TaxID=1979941 RepID=A0A7R9L4X4_9ACAR|nr:unnamed protein product [Medioppia subpectinata]CAG2115418.1 unnamed protein product [Medioppia subpectinata]
MFTNTLYIGLVLVTVGFGTGSAGPNSDPHFAGNRSVIVEMMEWKHSEVAKECELFMGPYGYGGVQVSPVHECAILVNRPWWERYQPVSYKIASRSGDEAQFADMVARCNKAGVRVYVDIVLNHMTMAEQGKGTAGDAYDGAGEHYTAVPYEPQDFHGKESCPNADLNIHDSDNPTEARMCQMGGLRDLNQARDNVRKHQADYLNKLIDHGVAGFRSDASQHQWPQDLGAIIASLHTLNTAHGFPANSHPFFYHEYIEHGPNVKATEYTPLGRVIEFKNYENLARVFRGLNNQRLCYLRNYGGGPKGWGMLDNNDAVVMVDNHDLQRGHSGDINVTVTFFEPKLLKLTTAFMLAWPYAVPRIMSSYYWPRNLQRQGDHFIDSNSYIGPPHDSSDNILDVTRNPDLSCNTDKWICEHRWRQIYNMVAFRNIAGAEPVQHWWEFNNQIAFSRGSKAYIAINNDVKPIDMTADTGLPAGTYCDVISGNLAGGKCTGRQVVVGADGKAHIVVDNKWDDPMIAFHIMSKL